MNEHPWGEPFLVHTSYGRRFFRICEACGAVVGSKLAAKHEDVCPGTVRD
jgi:hypothetical protein